MPKRQVFRPGQGNTSPKQQQIRNSISNFRKKILFQKAGSAENKGLPSSAQRTAQLTQAYSPTNRTAIIPTRKRKPREDKEQLIRVEDDMAEQQRYISAQVAITRGNRFNSNVGNRPPKHGAGLNISGIN